MENFLNYEFQILDFIQLNLKNPVLDKLMVIFTYLGSAGFIWILIALILFASNKSKRYGIAMLLSLLLCLIIGNITLKPLVDRIRPCDVNTAINLLIKHPTDASFPSGHTMSSFAAAVSLLYYDKKKGLFALVLAIAISFSRLYLYVHYPTDILAGMIIGILIAIVSQKLVDIYYKRKNSMIIDRYLK